MTGWDRMRREGRDAGMTLVELLVGSSLFLLLGALVLGTTITTSKAATTSRSVNNMNEEARVLLNRISRELREAREVRAVTNPTGFGHNPAAGSSITFWIDINRDESDVVPIGGEPEVLTYTHDVASGRVLLSAPNLAVPIPVLAGQVKKFALSYTSSDYLNDGALDGVKDGTVTWEELDAYPAGSAVGDGNRVLDVELAHVDSVKLDINVLDEPRQQNYQTQVSLRNKS